MPRHLAVWIRLSRVCLIAIGCFSGYPSVQAGGQRTAGGWRNQAKRAKARDWTQDFSAMPLGRRFRIHYLNEAPIVGTIIANESDTLSVRLDGSRKVVQVSGEGSPIVEPVEPTAQERIWLEQARRRDDKARIAALRKGDSTGRPLRVGANYHFEQIELLEVTGALVSLKGNMFHVRDRKSGKVLMLDPQTSMQPEPVP